MTTRSPRTWATRTSTLALVAGLILAGCGPSASISVQLGDAAIEVLVGGSATTEVTVVRSGGASADLTLDATGAPDWVTVDFAPSTLTSGAMTSTMTVDTDGDDPAATAASFTLTVTAMGGGLTASDELTVNVELLTVTGKTTGTFGEPATGLSVAIDGNAPIAVDVNGQFEGPEVAIPYDLIVYDTLNGWAHLYKDLTTTDLNLMSIAGTPTPSTATVSGDLSVAVGANQLGIVCIEGLDQVIVGCDQVTPTNTAYSIVANWYDGTTASARVSAWVVDVDGDGATTGFAAAGQTAINLSDGVPALADVTLGEGPDTKSVDVSVTPPSGIPLIGNGVLYQYSAYGSVMFPVGAASEEYTAALPDVQGATAAVVGLANSADATVYGWVNEEYSSGQVELVMPDPLYQLAPAAGTIDVNSSTNFTITNPSGAATTFVFSGPLSVLVSTNASETTIPDLTSIGMALPAATAYTWQAISFPHHETVDDLAAHGWASDLYRFQLMLSGGPGPATGSLVAGTNRNFTTE